jgi:hypothetical protein
MDEQLKAKWVEALRSGKYRQADGRLRVKESSKSYSYCCLGVLCRTMGAKWQDGYPMIGKTRYEDEDEYLLSTAALEITGLTYAKQGELAAMNDEGTPFRDIADYIETNL